MKCPTCGNHSLIEQDLDLICEFCRTVVKQPKPKVLETKDSDAVPAPVASLEEPLDWQRLFDSVLTIKNEDQIGTGFIIDSSGLVLTNYHVVKDAEIVYGNFDGSDINYPVYPIELGNEENDLCLLQIDSNNSFPAIPFASSTVNLGEEVLTVGNPHGIGLSVSKGAVSRLDSEGNLQLNMQLNPGNSGGPVLTTKGELVGIVSYLIQEISAMSFAIGIEAIEAFIKIDKELSE
jgi:S1-C subfamily serine protease